jgi:hypothetical protein
MGYHPEPAERIGFRHSSGSVAVLHTGCRHHLVLRRLPARHKDWYLEMVGLRHWREGGKTPAAEQKRHYIISMMCGCIYTRCNLTRNYGSARSVNPSFQN